MHEIHFIKQNAIQNTTNKQLVVLDWQNVFIRIFSNPISQQQKSFVSDLSKYFLIRGGGGQQNISPPPRGGPPLRGGLTDKLSDNPTIKYRYFSQTQCQYFVSNL